MNPVTQKLENKWSEKKFVCVGLDPELTKIPENFKNNNSISEALFGFNKSIIDQTAELVCAYKPNCAFYEAEGFEGREALLQTISYLRNTYPDIPIILDAKRGDIGNTNSGYVKDIFENLGVDGVTIHSYLGKEAMQPFLDKSDKLIIILVKTSNKGAGEFQDLKVEGKSLYQIVARNISSNWNKNGNCAVVVGATYPDELKEVRKIIGDIPILIPGIGAQGGDISMIKNGLNSKGEGIIVSSSRGIIFAPNPKAAALKMHEDILNSLK